MARASSPPKQELLKLMSAVHESFLSKVAMSTSRPSVSAMLDAMMTLLAVELNLHLHLSALNGIEPKLAADRFKSAVTQLVYGADCKQARAFDHRLQWLKIIKGIARDAEKEMANGRVSAAHLAAIDGLEAHGLLQPESGPFVKIGGVVHGTPRGTPRLQLAPVLAHLINLQVVAQTKYASLGATEPPVALTPLSRNIVSAKAAENTPVKARASLLPVAVRARAAAAAAATHAVMPEDVALSPIRVVEEAAAEKALARADALSMAQQCAEAAPDAQSLGAAADEAAAVAESEAAAAAVGAAADDARDEPNDEYWLEVHAEATAQRAKQLALCDEYEHALIKLAISDKARREALRTEAAAREQAAADAHRAAVEALVAAEAERKATFLAEWQATEAAHAAELERQKAALVESAGLARKASEACSEKVAAAAAKLRALLRF